MQINHCRINCLSCSNYINCKEIENKYGAVLAKNNENWRAIFDNGKRVGTPIRRCSHAIVKKHLDKFKNKKVLEIGCGPASEIGYKFCHENNIVYTGIDPDRLPSLNSFTTFICDCYFMNRLRNRILTYHIKKKKLIKKNNLQSYMKDVFPSKYLLQESFDLIYANNSIEHWHQKIENSKGAIALYKNDISHCYKLLKPGGQLLINFPVHVHGNILFVLGAIEKIEQFFDCDQWESVVLEHWRQQHDDLMPYAPVHRKKFWIDTYGVELNNIWLGNFVAKKL